LDRSARPAGPDASPSQVAAGGETAIVSPHPDLHLVVKELARYSDDAQTRQRKLTRIPVEVLRRALIEPVYRAASLRHGKVFIVDEAELLNPAGQNLLLKTLEEPPGHNTIILVTASEDRLLPTVRSRCLRVAFVPVAVTIVAQWVDEHSGELDPDARRWLIGFAGGSLGRASLALAHGLTTWADRVLPALEKLAEGKSHGAWGRAMAECIDEFAQRWVKQHPGGSKEAANKLGASLMWSMIANVARQRLGQLADGCEPSNHQRSTLEPWLGVIDALAGADELVANNVNLGIVCDHLAMAVDRSLTPAGSRGR
jgi:DNA polymerase-3 subunit delta'